MSLRPDLVTSTGESIYFLQPEGDSIKLADIRFALGNVSRYHGHIHWTVLQHLALCTVLARAHYGPGDVLAIAYTAVHDFHEAYVGDVNTHLKKLLPRWGPIEDLWEEAVHFAINLPLDHRPDKQVRTIDLRALAVEMHCHDYGGQKYVFDRYVQEPVTELEESLFNHIQSLSDDECWDIVAYALYQGVNFINNLEE